MEESNVKDYSKVILVTDGGARGNPGPGAIGGIVLTADRSTVLEKFSQTIGHTTNNQAEYEALIYGLELCEEYTDGEVIWYSDSRLVVSQMNGKFKVKNQKLARLHTKALGIAAGFSKLTCRRVSREHDLIVWADRLVNSALNRLGRYR